jgi:hypothetical protein
MSRTIMVISVDNGADAFARVIAELNVQLKERGVVGDSDAMDQCFDVCLADAVAKLGGVYDVRDRDDYYVALDGAPLTQILPGGTDD